MANFPYNFCPVCAAKLEERHKYGALRQICTACDFVRFRDPKVSVIGLVTVGNQVLITRRAVDPQKGKWSLPGGYMDAGEMPKDALKRELIEEVGLEIEVGKLDEIFPLTAERPTKAAETANNLSEANLPIEDTIGIVLAFEAWPLSGKAELLESNDDVSEAAWMDWAEIPHENLAFESTAILLKKWHSKNK